MKNSLFKNGVFRNTLFLTIMSLFLFSCGDAPVGFNVSKNFPVALPVTFDASFIAGIPGFNPPAIEAPYDLESVPGFEDALAESDFEIVFNDMSYEITDVSAAEEFDLDEIVFSVAITGGPTLDLVQVTGRLTNIPETPMGLTQTERDQLRDALSGTGGFTTSVTFDFAEAPTTNIDINVNILVDVTLKVRQ